MMGMDGCTPFYFSPRLKHTAQRMRWLLLLIGYSYILFASSVSYAWQETFCSSQNSMHRTKRKCKCTTRTTSPIVLMESNATRHGSQHDITSIHYNDDIERRKIKLRLNQRTLPKQILHCRDNVQNAIGLLVDAYPHLSSLLEQNIDRNSVVGDDTKHWSYESILDILQAQKHQHNITKKNGAQNMKEDYDICIIDGKSIVATMEVLRKTNNVIVALHLLRLSVEAVQHNQVYRKDVYDKIMGKHDDVNKQLKEDDRDKNELRRIYKAVISLLGHCCNKGQVGESSTHYSPRIIMYLLREHMPKISKLQPTSEIMHASINSLGRARSCDLILEILKDMEHSYEMNKLLQELDESVPTTNVVPPVDRMAYQTAISSLARHGHCVEATQLLYRMQDKGWAPDGAIYNELLIGIAKEAGRGTSSSAVSISDSEDGMMHQVALRILNEMEANNKQPTEQTYNSVISACGKEGAWDKISMLTSRKKGSVENDAASSKDCLISNSMETSTNNSIQQQSSASYFHNLRSFRKVGKGCDSWWEIGRYSVSNNDEKKKRSIIIGIQPHRNPVSNGLSIVFYDETSRDKLGRMLLRNTSSLQPHNKDQDQSSEPLRYSSLVGMEVNKTKRGEGLSKVFVAIWLCMCLETNTYPRAAVMNKPLIAHVLMGFNFVPQAGGSCVELIRLKKNDNNVIEKTSNPKFALYSPSAKSLQGLFSQRVLRKQGIAILDCPPSPESRKRGTDIYLKTRFEHPIAILENAVVYNPPLSLKREERFDISAKTTLSEKEDKKDCAAVSQGLIQQLKESQAKKYYTQSSTQRKLLAQKIKSILNTNDSGENGTTSGHLQFFNTIYLKGVF